MHISMLHMCTYFLHEVNFLKFSCPLLVNTEYLPPQIRSMNNRFNSEAKLPWSYDQRV